MLRSAKSHLMVTLLAFFAGLGHMRTIPRWTFNDAVMEADFAVGQLGSIIPPGWIETG